ncbi:myosin-11-like isoform X1 [Saccostrea cucullata]|uniref:myosin-11-like isoform X1 n=1 Tax=Saccostrea cuccullata TaxID=36930 RepID=UPI002ED3B14B
MASKVKEKIKKKSPKVVNQAEDERPSSAHSQISVKEAASVVDNTEKFTKDESKQEKENKNTQDKSSVEKSEDTNIKRDEKKREKEERKKDGKAKKSKNLKSSKEESTPSADPVPDKKRSPSPFGRNVVEPTQGSNMGSLASIKSHSTIREAWTDRSSMSELNSAPPSVNSSIISVREAARENRAYLANQQAEVTSDSSDEEVEETEEVKNAYIPYLYAKKSITKVIKDMKKMRSNHIRIVTDIQKEYKSIEDETQSQFNIFVINLREQYKGKVATFRQVIDIHRTELQSKESYWNEMLESLAERNRRLLKDKKVLLIQNKVEIERLEKEKVEIQTELSQKLDKATVALAAVEKEKTEEKNKEADLENEIKKLKEDLEKEKSAVTQLEHELAEERKLRAAAGVAVVASSVAGEQQVETKKTELKKETPVTMAVPVSAEEKEKMSTERSELEEERQRIIEERNQMEEERRNYGGEKKEWMDQINKLQQDITLLTKESSEWKIKYEVMKQQAEKSAAVQEKYAALEAQYQALAAIVTASEGTEAIAKENKKKVEDDRAMMTEEKAGLDKEIKQWEAQFKKKNGRQPTEEDKTDSVKEMYVQQEELDTMVNSLDKKLETYQKLESGAVLEPPEVIPTPIKEPEIQTVEVKVPDPMVMAQLEKEQAEVENLRAKIAELQKENTEKSSQISQQNEELSRLRDKISQLEAALKAGTVAVAATSINSEEVDALKKENKDMKKDMKKLLKRLEKEEEKAKAVNVDPDTRVQTLEEKVNSLDEKITDIESENETLKEQKLRTETEKEALLQQIQVLQQQVVTPGVTAAVAVTASTPVKSEPVDGCNVPAHADLIQQLEDKKMEIKELERQLQEKDTQIQEKILTIQDLEKELDKLRSDNKEMRTDMLKMAKQHTKLQHKLKDLVDFEKTKKLLEAMAFYVHEIHGEVPAAAEGVTNRLEVVSSEALKFKESQEKSIKAVEAWVAKFTKKNGREPGVRDRDSDGERAYKVLEENGKLLEDKKIMLEALQIMKTGDYKAPESRVSMEAVSEESPVEKMEQQMTAMDDKLTDLETDNDNLRRERNDAVAKLKDLELQLEQAKNDLQLQTTLASGLQDSQELSEQITDLQKQLNASESSLLQERTAHTSTREELENLRKQMEVLREEVDTEKADLRAQRESDKRTKDAENKAQLEEINALKSRNEQLEMERLANVPVDTAKEIKDLQAKIAALEKEKSGAGTANATLQAQIGELKTKLEGAQKNTEAQRAANRELEAKNKSAKADKDKAIKEVTQQIEKREQQRANEDKKRIAALEKKIRDLEAGGVKPVAAAVAGGKAGSDAGDKVLKEQLANLKRENNELNTKIKQLDAEIKRGARQATTMGNEDKNDLKRKEKILKELEKKYEIEKNKTSKLGENLKTTEEELKVTKKERDEKENELKKVTAELSALGVAAKQGMEAATKVKTLETDNKKLMEENKVLTENYNSERVLRKKYYNMVEDMKGKIRVYCRARPLSSGETERGNFSVVKSPDEYTINVESSRGTKEFQFDSIFMEDSTQEKIFDDTNNLIQSAMDGYNVCIFAYGQTGSGKTFTMIGDKEQKFPGIAPRAFERIFSLAHEVRNKFHVKVSSYMMELYNDKLIDLYAKPGTSDDDRMDIKKDKKGLVYVQGAVIKEATNAKELFGLFEEGSKNRHVASTKMNAESSRSHLIIGITIETTNRTTGQVLTGKLSLVDLAGSERVAKTGATAEQLKEAMSINKSLSALGDVISALSSDQQFIPYRNHKLTMLMQDSLGGNAKTLMFVNISPADYNQDETIISLMYASRVKLITNDASKNAENKEINRLKNIIAKLKKGETVNEDDE